MGVYLNNLNKVYSKLMAKTIYLNILKFLIWFMEDRALSKLIYSQQQPISKINIKNITKHINS